jgi:hypothetical protein
MWYAGKRGRKRRYQKLFMKLHPIWRRLTATRYTRALEAEVARLLAENRALLNSILGIAGVPPITVLPDSVSIGAPAAERVADASAIRHKHRRTRQAFTAAGPAGTSTAQSARPSETPGTTVPPSNGNAQGANVVMPMRRRSWHQIYRMLEIDSARKKPQEAVNIPPATRG